jgi:hypothetical protein
MHNIALMKQQSSKLFDESVPFKRNKIQRFTNTKAPKVLTEHLLYQPSTDQEPEFDPIALSSDALIGSSNNNSASVLDRQGMLTFGNFANIM